jgi:hypothetical protein
MLDFLAIVYGIHLVLLLYVIAYVTVRGITKGGSIPFYIVLGKYFIYWQVITFGFNHLSGKHIMIGLTAGIYLSLPLLYFVNRYFNKKLEDISAKR